MNLKNLAMWAVIVFLTIGLYNMFKNPQNSVNKKDTIIFSDFLTEVDISMPQMRQDLNRTIEYQRALQDQEYQKQLEEAQREQVDPDAPMAGGGIANVRRPWAIPPASGPMPQGGGLSSQFNRVRKLPG